MRPETAPLSESKSPKAGAELPPRGDPREGRLARLVRSLRFDGLWWRKVMRLGCVYLPDWFKRLAPPVFALIIFALVKRNRRGAIANQARVLGIDPGRIEAAIAAYRVFARFARCMTETLEFYGPRPGRFRIDEPAVNPVTEALRKGRGVILATAHAGNWDISARALHATGRPVNMVIGREVNETSQDYARRTREQAGVRVILSDSSVFSAFNMIRVLRRNEIIAIQLDRGSTGPTAPAGIRRIPFFGADAYFHEGPFHLARLSGAPVVPVFTLYRGPRHYEIVTGEPRYVSREVPGDVERALREAVALFESIIREHPDQWFQFAPFWPAEPSLGARQQTGSWNP